VAAYESALELGAAEPEYYYELGLALAYLERCDEARPWLLKALEVDPNAAPALEGLKLCPEKKVNP
jgi:Flp pilus assembly protein TadD